MRGCSIYECEKQEFDAASLQIGLTEGEAKSKNVEPPRWRAYFHPSLRKWIRAASCSAEKRGHGMRRVPIRVHISDA